MPELMNIELNLSEKEVTELLTNEIEKQFPDYTVAKIDFRVNKIYNDRNSYDYSFGFTGANVKLKRKNSTCY